MNFDAAQFKQEVGEFIGAALRRENDGNLERWLIQKIIDAAFVDLRLEIALMVKELLTEELLTEESRWADDGGLTV